MSIGQVDAVREIAGEVGQVPCPRDRAIYQAVCVEGRPAREVARQFELATTTVRNIAQTTQRALARMQHELDARTDCDSLKHYYDRFTLQLDEVEQAWDVTRQPGDRVRQTTTTTTKTLASGEKQVLEKVVVARMAESGRGPAGNFQLVSLANRILTRLMSIETVYKARRQEERDSGERGSQWEQALTTREQVEEIRREIAQHRAQEQAKASPAAPAGQASPEPAAESPAAKNHPARDLHLLATASGVRPRPASELPLTPPARPKPMSRRERHRQAREREAARAARTESVSAPPQAAGGQGFAAMHVEAR